jgi:hypothetical protein
MGKKRTARQGLDLVADLPWPWGVGFAIGPGFSSGSGEASRRISFAADSIILTGRAKHI